MKTLTLNHSDRIPTAGKTQTRASEDDLSRMRYLTELLLGAKSPRDALPNAEEKAIGPPDLRATNLENLLAEGTRDKPATNFPKLHAQSTLNEKLTSVEKVITSEKSK